MRQALPTAKLKTKRLKSKVVDADTKLMHGAVPQLDDWVDVWAGCSTLHSTNGMMKCNKKLVVNGRRWNYHRTRKMIAIMAEVLREQDRKRLRAATCIALSIDASECRKVVRFRCDTPEPAAGGEYVARGILGVLSCEQETLLLLRRTMR